MNYPTTPIHLRNMLSCLKEIEQHCTDLTTRDLEDEDLFKHLKINFTVLGLEAINSGISDPIMDVLKSFMFMDFQSDMGGDRYALYSFIVNDLGMIKQSIIQMQAPKPGRTSLDFGHNSQLAVAG